MSRSRYDQGTHGRPSKAIWREHRAAHRESMNEAFLKTVGSWISDVVDDWVRRGVCKNTWREPLVAAASAANPLFPKLREAVGPEHAMPEDLLQGARSVMVFFLPFQGWVGKENDEARGVSARSWAESYVVTNRLIVAINDRLTEMLEAMGYLAAPTPPTHNFDQEKLVSGWSHKHIATIAGLGTFGHNHLLITPSGCCGRLGSLVTTMPLAATPRPDRENCLVKSGQKCHACVSKCRYGALFKTHFDRQACYRQCLVNDAHFRDLPLTDVCGKCACGVPCSHEIPEGDTP